MPDLRRDPIVGRWVIISTERGVRPRDFVPDHQARQPTTGLCPFCPGQEKLTPHEVLAYRPNGGEPNDRGWTVRVIPNKFPALQVEGDMGREGIGLYDRMNGIGAHEVIIETDDHKTQLADGSAKQIEDVLWAYRDRVVDLKRDLRFRYILIFKNHGAAAGATMEHSHSQLIALPVVPTSVLNEIEGCRSHFQKKERCIYCDIVRQELADAERVVHESERFLAVVPYAGRGPFELWILPRQHAAAYEDALSGDLVADLARMVAGCFRTLARALGDPSVEMTLYTAPNRGAKVLAGEWATLADDYHWHIGVIPGPERLKRVGGIYVTDTAPEAAASRLRDAWAQG